MFKPPPFLQELQNERERLVAVAALSEQPSEENKELEMRLQEKQSELDVVAARLNTVSREKDVRHAQSVFNCH